jgi:hypothetical protein
MSQDSAASALMVAVATVVAYVLYSGYRIRSRVSKLRQEGMVCLSSMFSDIPRTNTTSLCLRGTG